MVGWGTEKNGKRNQEVSTRSDEGSPGRDKKKKRMDGDLRFCRYESFLFLTLLDVAAAATGAALLAMPDADELDRCLRAHPSQLRARRTTTTKREEAKNDGDEHRNEYAGGRNTRSAPGIERVVTSRTVVMC